MFCIKPIAASQTLPVDLLTAGNFRILAGSGVTIGIGTAVTGDLGVSPGTTVNNAGTLTGAIHLDDAAAIQAQTGLVATYDDAAGRLPGVAVTDHLSPGHYVYRTKQVDMNVYFAGLESGGEQMMRPLVLTK